jgi:hypothetical protein
LPKAISAARLWPHLVVLVMISGTGCGAPSRHTSPGPAGGTSGASLTSSALADVLWLPSEATLVDDMCKPVEIKNGRSIYVDGTAGVTFRIAADPEELSRGIVQHFAATTWRPRGTEYLNPQDATSFERGWDVRYGGAIAGRTTPHEPYRQWHGEWEDERGNIVTYHLGGIGHQLRGIASYLPRSVVEAVRRQTGRQ